MTLQALIPSQESAVQEILTWLRDSDEPFYILSGSAGTGKTFCMAHLVERYRRRVVFTAPTNKATKVLRETLRSDKYEPQCRTTYSLLGLRLEENGEVRELAVPEDPIDLTEFGCIVVDEASMVNQQLFGFIQRCAADYGAKFLFLGDPVQLPPVKEAASAVWKIPQSSKLTVVKRHDNQILRFATKLRDVVNHPCPTVVIRDDHDESGGVYKVGSAGFTQELEAAARRGDFSRQDHSKAIAWRNVTVEELNKRVRAQIFDNHHEQRWLPGDLITFLSPAKNQEDEPIATTDAEGKVESVSIIQHPEYADYKVYAIHVQMDEGRSIEALTLHESSFGAYTRHLTYLSNRAKENRRMWRDFWLFKDAFHQCRHAYAITAHRSQGSTYNTAFVDWQDILTNRNRQEAFRCLYVACTRPKERLYLS